MEKIQSYAKYLDAIKLYFSSITANVLLFSKQNPPFLDFSSLQLLLQKETVLLATYLSLIRWKMIPWQKLYPVSIFVHNVQNFIYHVRKMIVGFPSCNVQTSVAMKNDTNRKMFALHGRPLLSFLLMCLPTVSIYIWQIIIQLATTPRCVRNLCNELVVLPLDKDNEQGLSLQYHLKVIHNLIISPNLC